MARETKVGLLAGLAFIICFAIILSNRGDDQAVGTPWSASVSGVRGPSVAAADSFIPASSRTAQRPLNHNDDASLTGVARSSPANSAQRRPHHTGRPPSAPASGAQVIPSTTLEGGPVFVSRIPDGAEANTNTMLPDAARGHARNIPANAPDDAPGPKSSSVRWNPTEHELKEQLQALDTGAEPNPGSRANGTLTPPRVPSQTPKRGTPRASDVTTSLQSSSPNAAGRIMSRYRVKPGDTLYGIAAEQYGKPDATIVKAIFDANRSVLSEPDDLRAGTEILLPSLDGVERARAISPPATAGRRDGAAGFRWYQIQKNDRYITIARQQLGDAGRWREIFELNKDKFPDPQRIREGVRIKIPSSPKPARKGQRP